MVLERFRQRRDAQEKVVDEVESIKCKDIVKVLVSAVEAVLNALKIAEAGHDAHTRS